MMANLDLVEDINRVKRQIANWTLWLIPPQRYAYLAYADAVDRYIQTLRMEILANEPHLFEGRVVTIEGFKYLRTKRGESGHWIASSRDIDVYLDKKPTKNITIKGKISLNKTGRAQIRAPVLDSHKQP
jgi:hypothetical protein